MNLSFTIGEFYAGECKMSKEEIQSEIERYEEIIEEWGDDCSCDQGYQDDLMTLNVLKEVFNEYDNYYDENGSFLEG